MSRLSKRMTRKPLATSTIDELHRPGDELTAEAHHEQQRLAVVVAVDVVLDRDPVDGRRSHGRARYWRHGDVARSPGGPSSAVYRDRHMGLFRRSTDPAEIERMKAELAALRAAVERAGAAEPPADPRVDELAGELAALDARVTAVSTELANQLTELGHDIDALGARPSADGPTRPSSASSATARCASPTSRPATRSPSARTSPAWPTSSDARSLISPPGARAARGPGR